MPAPAERRHRGALPVLSAEAARAVLSSPRLTAAARAAAERAREAATLVLPVRLAIPAAAGRVLIARTLHAVSGRPGPLLAGDGRARGLCDLPAGGTLLLDAATLTSPALAALEALLDDGSTWLLLASETGHALPPPIAARLDVVTVEVPPLASRLDDLPALAEHLLSALAARRGGARVTLTPAALAHLSERPWPGDVVQLEAALGAALLCAGRDATSIDASHFLGDAPAAAPAEADHGAQLEYLVAQLAHELRNPLASVRTFSQLPGLADDADLRARFVAVTDEAIARMDGLLETASAFATLGAPAPADVALGPLLDALVAEVRPGLAERAVRLDYASPNGARCRGDAAQLRYALRAVLDGVAREVADQDVVAVDATAPGCVRIAFDPRNGTAERLKRVLQADGGGRVDDVLPLALVLGRAVVERNGGSLCVTPQADGRALVEIRLPGADTAGGG